jgi:hypothetical protein
MIFALSLKTSKLTQASEIWRMVGIKDKGQQILCHEGLCGRKGLSTRRAKEFVSDSIPTREGEEISVAKFRKKTMVVSIF